MPLQSDVPETRPKVVAESASRGRGKELNGWIQALFDRIIHFSGSTDFCLVRFLEYFLQDALAPMMGRSIGFERLRMIVEVILPTAVG